MIQEITHFVNNFIIIRVFSGYNHLGCLFTDLFKNLVDSFFVEIIGIRTFSWIIFSVLYNLKYCIKNLLRILLGIILFSYLVKEAGITSGVTCSANLLNLGKNGIKIAICCKRLNILEVRTGLALYPELISAPAKVCHLTCSKRIIICLLIHIGQHKNLICSVILNDNRNHSVRILFKLFPGKCRFQRTNLNSFFS